MKPVERATSRLVLSLMIAAISAIAYALPSGSSAETIVMQPLVTAPVLDGNTDDWTNIPGVTVMLHKNKQDTRTSTKSLLIKGGVYANEVYFYIEWEDATEDTLHKPWVWDAQQLKYVRGPQREDRLALQFVMEGDYSTDWFSGKTFTADMWHWKASRSNPLGLAHDKSTTISSRKLLRASKHHTPAGDTIYIQRPSDQGDKLYITRRYRKHDKDVMPKYILAAQPHGSSADIKAHGVWRAGKWRLEIRRKLNTGHQDDVAFPGKGSVSGGIAVFDHSENDDHAISRTLQFQF